jgi:hypothetical protein
MLDTPTLSNQQDFRQRYCSGYGYILTEDKKTLVYLREIRNNTLVLQDEDNGRYMANLDSGVMFEFVPVFKGWSVAEGSAAFVSRVPAKQFSRAISSSNTTMSRYFPAEDLLDPISLTVTRLRDALEYVYNIPDAVENYLKGLRYAVLSKHFAICGSRLYFYNEPIGSVSCANNTVKLTLDNKLCEQEIRDLLNRNNITNVVIA